jgi:hypothetical protein
METIDVRVDRLCQLGGEEMPLSCAEGGLIYTVYGRLLLRRLKGFSLGRDALHRHAHSNRDKIASCGSIVRLFQPNLQWFRGDAGKPDHPTRDKRSPRRLVVDSPPAWDTQKGSF